jgi:hypothetical protein
LGKNPADVRTSASSLSSSPCSPSYAALLMLPTIVTIDPTLSMSHLLCAAALNR